MVNITELKEAEQALREESRTLETLNRIGTSLAAELDLEKLVQVVTEAGKEVTGAESARFRTDISTATMSRSPSTRPALRARP